MEPTFTVSRWVATIRLNRPEQHNRLGGKDIAHLRGIIHEIDQAADIRAVILTAYGPSFCSGFDLSELKAAGAGAALFEDMVCEFENMRQPSVCAMNGSVYGGATDLALACDFRIGVPSMKFLMPAVRIGLQFYGSGLRRYVSRLGIESAKQLLLLAPELCAPELLQLGFLQKIVDEPLLLGLAGEIAERLSAGAPLAMQGMKRALNAIAVGSADDRALKASFEKSLLTADFSEGVDAARSKRPPRFKGR